MWKPGQLVTIRGRIYRVTKVKSCLGSCILCEFRRLEEDVYPCSVCFVVNNIIASLKIPAGCYLQRIIR